LTAAAWWLSCDAYALPLMPPMSMLSPVGLVDKIKSYRTAHGCSMHEAKRAVEREYLLQGIEECRTFYELKQLVRVLAERWL